MAITIIQQDSEVAASIILNATIRESHSIVNEITSFPVEEGADISDNIKLIRSPFVADCLISNIASSIKDIASRAQITQGVREYSGIVYDYLYDLAVNHEKLTIGTSLDVYEDMYIKSISIPVTAATSDALEFTITFQPIIFVSSSTSESRQPEEQSNKDATKKEKNTGKKKTTDTNAQEKAKAVDQTPAKGLTDLAGLTG